MDDRDGGSEQCGHSGDPAPTPGLAQESSDGGTNGGAKPWHGAEDTHCHAALVCVEHVCNDTTSVCHCAAPKHSSKEAEEQQCVE